MFEQNAKKLLQKLGIKADQLENEAADIDAIAARFKSDYKAVELADDLERERVAGRTGAYKKLQNDLIKKFGLDAEKYNALQNGQLETILDDVSAILNAAPKDKKEDPQIAQMLTQAQAKLKEYEAKLAEMPTALEAAKKEGLKHAKKEAIFNAQIEAAKQGIDKNFHPLVESAVRGLGLTVDFIDDDFTKYAIAETKDGQTVRLQKTPTELYTNLQEVLLARNLITENMKATTQTAPATKTPIQTPVNVAPNSGAGRFLQKLGG